MAMVSNTDTERNMGSDSFALDAEGTVIRVGDRVEYDRKVGTIDAISDGLIRTSATGWALPHTVRKV